eukprot:CAMPEP_0175041908 /NCGR_PEP_ID=MMETSP0052_2-20121109/2217_1 /TAXON_ID=51329 ORGANISM="Polytomella parva, Strain SAG 63-3" /NCGR_SAMPLE_ID=MMETSP0052_2 /ASSEMBLY_ACC=CAM_ASM_000194 /LENGTH=201 /DNA_ID=CAMNT_0016304557 /DNA_START=231 /DNA_END=833 /DNA_ORIENTATION=+
MGIEYPGLSEIISNIHKDKIKTVIYVTGGGSQAISWLLSVPGASNTILEASIPYSRKSFIEILGKEPKQYCSADAAMDLAKAAYRRAANLSDFYSSFVGIGASCALATGTPKKGPHRAFIALHGSTGSRVLRLDLAKEMRSRSQEEDIVSRALIQLLHSITANEVMRKNSPSSAIAAVAATVATAATATATATSYPPLSPP